MTAIKINDHGTVFKLARYWSWSKCSVYKDLHISKSHYNGKASQSLVLPNGQTLKVVGKAAV